MFSNQQPHNPMWQQHSIKTCLESLYSLFLILTFAIYVYSLTFLCWQCETRPHPSLVWRSCTLLFLPCALAVGAEMINYFCETILTKEHIHLCSYIGVIAYDQCKDQNELPHGEFSVGNEIITVVKTGLKCYLLYNTDLKLDTLRLK